MTQFTDEQHLRLGRKLKVSLIKMILEKWNDKDFTSLKDVEHMVTDILEVFQHVSANAKEIIDGRPDPNWN